VTCRLQCANGILVHRKLILHPSNLICTNCSSNIAILYQALEAPQFNTKGCVCGLNCEVVVDIRKDKLSMAENMFNIDSCGYGTNASAPKIIVRNETTHQE